MQLSTRGPFASRCFVSSRPACTPAMTLRTPRLFSLARHAESVANAAHAVSSLRSQLSRAARWAAVESHEARAVARATRARRRT
jgi:hypothetical protein